MRRKPHTFTSLVCEATPVVNLPFREGLFEEFTQLVEIEICRSRAMVPENNRLLRCFQYLSLNSISYGDFCWNGDCTNCQIWYHTEGQSKDDDRTGLSCRMEVIEGMVITSMSPFIRLDGITK